MIGNGQQGAAKQGGIDVNKQSQTSPFFQYFLIEEQKDDILLTSDISVNDEVVHVSPGHGFTGIVAAPGEHIVIWENNQSLQVEVESVAANAITISNPIARTFTAAGAKVIRGNNQLAVNASGGIDFQMRIQDFTIPIDISKIILTMFHSGAGDDSKFGGITALPKGMWFRKENSELFNLGNYKNNQAFKNRGADVTYPSKGPGGTESTDIVFDLELIFGQVMRMDSRLNDIFRGQGRDDMTGLDSLIISMIGSYTSGE